MHDANALGGGATMARAVRVRGMVGLLGRVFILAAIPLSLIWLPVGRLPGAGNVSAGDAAEIGLWVLTLAALVLHTRVPTGARAPWMVVLTVTIAALAAVAAQFVGAPETSGLEFMLLMKRFALSSIIPLAAVVFGSSAMRGWTRALTAIMLAVLVAMTLDPALQEYLPRPDAFDADIFQQRAVGSVTNPNDLAYASIALFILHAAFFPARARTIDWVILLAGLAGSVTCFVSSGSRSGVMGAAGALMFIVLTSGFRLRTKLALMMAASLAVAVGFSYSTVFQQRVGDAYREGTRERNIGSRIEGQALAARISLEHPFGIGYTRIARATSRESSILEYGTSDSVYFDTLLGAGYLGLLVLLALFWTAWRHVGSSRPPGDTRAHVLKAGIVAFLLFGTATVVPISVFLSPLFFQMVGAAAYPDDP